MIRYCSGRCIPTSQEIWIYFSTINDDIAYKIDWAHLIKELVDNHFPDKKIILVMDNLNTHKLGSLYAAFEQEEARRIAKRLEIHYTPKHGSWLDMAEIEIGVLSRQCLNRRIPDQETLRTEINAWQEQRNQKSWR